jgi:hypothetical protein
VVGWDTITSSFIIFDLQTFIEKLLVKYYNNPNMNSFIRQVLVPLTQVNNYGFSKIPRGDGLYQYHNKHFVLGKWESLYKVKRVSSAVHKDDSCDYGSGDKECNHCAKMENRISKLENTVVYLVNQLRELKLINQSLNSYICNKKM